MTRREFTFSLAALQTGRPLRAAAFRADVTPALGEPLIWVDPARTVLDPLWAKGLVLESTEGRFVLCTVDWCGLGGWMRDRIIAELAAAVRTRPERVTLHTVHQHTAPYVESGAYELLRRLESPPLMLSETYLGTLIKQVAQEAAAAVARLEDVDSIAFGAANVERVAGARRIMAGGKLVTRFSTGAKDPAMAALPEGDVDTRLRTITLFNRKRPLARLHLYACHPQTFCCTGEVSSDFVGAAREAVEKEEGVPQIYFTGCAGDITAGKYNDGSPQARQQLAQRLAAGMRASNKASSTEPLRRISWHSVPLPLPAAKADWPPHNAAALSGQELSRRAIRAAFALRRTPVRAVCLTLNDFRFLVLPGEPMLDFQRHAPDALIAGYGDISPGYMCPDAAFQQGGYEPSASNTGPGAEAVVKRAISQLVAG
jgi:hypothetical protein